MSGGIIEQPGRGYVKFSVPYLREHLMEREQAGLRSLGIFKSSKKSTTFFFWLKTCRRKANVLQDGKFKIQVVKKQRQGHELY